jgi:hypothetical protein
MVASNDIKFVPPNCGLPIASDFNDISQKIDLDYTFN